MIVAEQPTLDALPRSSGGIRASSTGSACLSVGIHRHGVASMRRRPTSFILRDSKMIRRCDSRNRERRIQWSGSMTWPMSAGARRTLRSTRAERPRHMRASEASMLGRFS